MTGTHLEIGAALPSDILDRTVMGVGLSPGVLRDQLSPNGTLLVFLRHFGCIFCRETLGELRATSQRHADYPDVLFFFQGSATEGRAFLRRDWPDARAVADPDMALYERFGVGRASFYEAFRPAVWSASLRAHRKGYRPSERSGDMWRMPGVFAVVDERLIWAHRAEHTGDQPDFDAIPRLFAGVRDGARPDATGADGVRARVSSASTPADRASTHPASRP